MNPQNWSILASSEALSATFEKGVSVTANPPPGAAWSVVPQARRPATVLAAVTVEASQRGPLVAHSRSDVGHLRGKGDSVNGPIGSQGVRAERDKAKPTASWRRLRHVDTC